MSQDTQGINSPYRPLPETFRTGGFNFHQLRREGDIILLEKSKPGYTRALYEVVIVKKNKRREWPDGRSMEPWESMPADEDWGTFGFSPATLELATEAFENLVNSSERAK